MIDNFYQGPKSKSKFTGIPIESQISVWNPEFRIPISYPDLLCFLAPPAPIEEPKKKKKDKKKKEEAKLEGDKGEKEKGKKKKGKDKEGSKEKKKDKKSKGMDLQW